MLLNSEISVLLTIPFLVANTKYLISSDEAEISTIELMFSSLSNCSKFIIGIPFDCLENSGTSYPFIR